ncbi:TIGR03016 family PEP-CTERM system-associated outer membrane protein [Photobacterium sanguinicancri]|uniref:TIGR03016 family PEP-CTERM system-associated outer membrane protein n=1 Tax=Photobacterium sanguinicancri TaxID=875932 RepID=UPI0026E2CC46|nr:TIGR03016 family PEP-CTERM system-associated outer membrane protein [Photobacterium sanguinicancri]MDO6498003.1 TIGR03016 family PEP-CTERM system-associated outer membrane protein [Photobacterium sanguinicancri]
MAMTRKRRNPSIYVIGVASFVSMSGYSADVTFTPSVDVGLVFTDNVDREPDKTASFITTIGAGLKADILATEGYLNFDYQIRQLLYSDSSDRDDLYNNLDFVAEKGIAHSGFFVDANASVQNVAKSLDDDAAADIFSGNTVENQRGEIGFGFRSNPLSQIDLESRVFTRVSRSGDRIGDYNGYGASVSFANGQSIKDVFWQIDASYDYKKGREDEIGDTRYTALSETVGLQTVYGFSPLMRLNYENLEGSSDLNSRKTVSWGPGVRYFWHKRSYAELSYNFSEDDVNPDFWAGSLNFNPTPRTRLYLEYGKRFFGDAYEFLFSHRNRRVTNTVSYTEEPVSFDRTNFTVGDRPEDITLVRLLDWTSTLDLRRSQYSFSLFGRQEEALTVFSENQDERSYGTRISGNHNLTRRFKINGAYEYATYDFDRLDGSNQNDDYHTFDIGGVYQHLKKLTSSFGYRYSTRQSSSSIYEYDENRFYYDLKMSF